MVRKTMIEEYVEEYTARGWSVFCTEYTGTLYGKNAERVEKQCKAANPGCRTVTLQGAGVGGFRGHKAKSFRLITMYRYGLDATELQDKVLYNMTHKTMVNPEAKYLDGKAAPCHIDFILNKYPKIRDAAEE